MIERNLTEERIYSENEIKMIDMHRQKLLLKPKLKDEEKAFDKSCKAVEDYLGWWLVAQVPLVAGAVLCFDQMPWYTQVIWAVAGTVSEGMMVYDVQKYLRAKSAFLKTKEKYSQLQEGIKACKAKLTQEEKAYLVLEEGVNLSE